MTYPPYMREKARQLRREQDLTIDEIAERLAVSRTTVYFWVGDMPRPKRVVQRANPPPAELGSRAMQAKYRRLREEAYELGRWEFPRIARTPTFRDFVCLYIAEGYKRHGFPRKLGRCGNQSRGLLDPLLLAKSRPLLDPVPRGSTFRRARCLLGERIEGPGGGHRLPAKVEQQSAAIPDVALEVRGSHGEVW